MSYVVFARKFRPQQFDEVVGQAHIVTTLTHAIERDRVAQSFLFTGSRGVGKTSTARILAKALNCEKGPATTSCGECTSCDEITRGMSLDVLEIDGASNRGIDEVRTLRENVKFKPAHGRCKIYIIDEVHMLTTEAFNALLKTLEEPPPHVKFVFATTEPHKVPLTILSRCQRFDFARIKTSVIAETLTHIAKREQLAAEPEALFLIAKAAEGSLRDAESLFEQLATHSQGTLTRGVVEAVLGLTTEGTLLALLSALTARKGQGALAIARTVQAEGKDLVQLTRGLLEMFRHVLVVQTAGPHADLVDLTREGLAAVQTEATHFTKEETLFAVNICQRALSEVKRSDTPELYLDVALLTIVARPDLVSLETLLARLGELESALGGSREVAAQSPAHQAKAVARKIVKAEQQAAPPAPPARGEAVAPANTAQATRATESAAVALPEPAPAVTLDQVEAAWPQALRRVKEQKMSTGIFLSEAEPVGTEGNVVVFGFPNEFRFHKETLEKRENRDLIEAAFRDACGVPVRIQFVITEAEKRSVTSAADTIEAAEATEEVPEIVESARAIFEGRVVKRERPR